MLEQIYENASCADKSVNAEWWFADTNHEQELAKQICQGCQVIAGCLKYALQTNERYGIWGGLDPDQRIALARKTAKLVNSKRKAENVN